MDLEEERLRHQIEDHERALKQKIKTLKERFEHLKSMADVKAQVRQHPALMLTGSIFAGFLTKKLVGSKDRRAPYPEHINSHPAPAPGNAASAIISAIATRAAIGIITEVVGKLLPRKHDKKAAPAER
ncbi:MAG TPA: hypothetical protein VIE89_17940 [Candidatus Binatia bacterium]|jgi:hypothetical protein